MAEIGVSADFKHPIFLVPGENPAGGVITIRLLTPVYTESAIPGAITIHRPYSFEITLDDEGLMQSRAIVPDDPAESARYSATLLDGKEVIYYLSSLDGPTADLGAIIITNAVALPANELAVLLSTYTPLATTEALTINDLADVDADSPAENDRLAWNDTDQVWEPRPGSAGISNHAELDNLDYASAAHTGFSSAVALADETSARTLADISLDADIASEQSARIAADVGLAADLDTEEAARISADSTEQAARIDADLLLQPISTLPEVIDDRVAALLAAGSGISLTYNDLLGILTIAATGGAALTWISLTPYLNTAGGTTWVATGGDMRPPEYAIDGLFVRIRGAVTRTAAGTNSNIIFTGLPIGIRPAYRQFIDTCSQEGYAQVDILTPGDLRLWTGGVNALTLTYGWWV